MRLLGLVGVLCLACSRANPAFDGTATDDGKQSEGPDTIGTVTLDPGDGTALGTTAVGTTAPGTTEPELETSASSDTAAATDLPIEPICVRSPSPGLDIQAGDPASFGGVCPTGIFIWTMLASSDGNGAQLYTCNDGCVLCTDETQPVSMFPLSIGDYVPAGRCLRLEVTELVFEEETRCHFGALTIHEPGILAPHVIATTHAAAPTPAALDILADAIPEPMLGLDCTCAQVDQANDCCESAPSSPAFYFFPIGDQDVYAGDEAPLTIANPGGLSHTFQVFQAQDIPTCENQQLEISWAVLADP